jgi:hypothetical protein
MHSFWDIGACFFSITVPRVEEKLYHMAWALEHAEVQEENALFCHSYPVIFHRPSVYRDYFLRSKCVEHHSNINEETTSDERKLSIKTGMPHNCYTNDNSLISLCKPNINMSVN